jgi:D-alanine-D-alanine ligase
MSIPSLKVAVIGGGPGAEREVSLSSANGIAEALRATWPDVVVLDLNGDLPGTLLREKYDVVFPALHGTIGEDGTIQGFLEILGLPYVGSGVLASACGLNKIVAKQIFRAFNLPVAREVIVEAGEPVDAAIDRIERSFPLDVVIKPVAQGSAIGVGFARTREELSEAMHAAQAFGDRILIEERISGKEVTCAVLEKPHAEALTTVEVRTPQGAWYDYSHRYTVGMSEHVIPADLPAARNERVKEIAVLAHQALQCRDFSRADFVVPEGGDPILLEVNTLPGMTPTSLFPDAARSVGFTLEEVARDLVLRAWGRRDSMQMRS